MRQHRDQIGAWRLVHTLVPKPREISQHLAQLGHALFGPQRVGVGEFVHGRYIRPPGQQAPVFHGEVKQRGQHHGGELNRDFVHPVKRFATRQAVQHRAGAFTDQLFHVGQIPRRNDGAHGLALIVVLGRVHGDEHGQLLAHRRVDQGDATQAPVGREQVGVGIHMHDVLVLGDRPIRPHQGAHRVVHRVFTAQPLEGVLHGVVNKKLGVGGVEFSQRCRQHGSARRLLLGRVDRDVLHSVT